MMSDMGSDEEFAEFDVTEDQIDAMMATGQPVEIDVPGEHRSYIESLYVLTGSPLTLGGAAVTPPVVAVVPSVKVSVPAGQHSGAAA